MILLARSAMVLSLAAFAGVLIHLWMAAFAADPVGFWLTLGLGERHAPAPFWAKVAGPLLGANAVLALGYCYATIWRLLSIHGDGLFAALSQGLLRLSNGLIYFWISFGLATGLLPALAVSTIEPDAPPLTSHWNPFGINSVFLILGLAFRPLAAALKRAGQIDDENKSFV